MNHQFGARAPRLVSTLNRYNNNGITTGDATVVVTVECGDQTRRGPSFRCSLAASA